MIKKHGDKTINRTKYKAYSLVELLISIFIMSIILLMIGVTTTKMLQVSARATAIDKINNEFKFVSQDLKRNIAKMELGSYFLIDSAESEVFRDLRLTQESGLTGGNITEDDFDIEISVFNQQRGDILFIRDYSNQSWKCYASVQNHEGNNQIVYSRSLEAWECLNPSSFNESGEVLTSSDNTLKGFEINSTDLIDGNTSFIIDILMSPKTFGQNISTEELPEFSRRFEARTQKLSFIR